MTTTETPPATETPLGSVCPCGCVEPSSRLFRPGHDMRFKSALRHAHANAADVRWDAELVSVDTAIDRIAAILGSDWSQVPLGGKPQPANRPSRPRSPSAPVASTETTEDTVVTTSPPASTPPAEPPRRPRRSRSTLQSREQRIDALMERLDTTVRTGHWGWYRPPTSVDTRLAARVHRTYRDEGLSTVDLFLPNYDTIVTGVALASFFVDPMAKP